jgi:succinyl-diaminopimelate desuccinylase
MCALHDLAGQDDVRVRLLCVPDEESEDIERRTSDEMVRRGFVGDFAITGEPTNLLVGVQAKGVLSCRIAVHGRAAHSSTPWLGDNAVLKAIDVFRRIESLPFSRESSELFDRPSINLGRIVGGDAVNKVPDECVMDVDIRYLPNQDPDEILGQIRSIEDLELRRTFVFPPAHVSRSNPYVRELCQTVSAATHHADSVTVGRDGASDAVSFLKAGIPAVEFGPAGGGHHGPGEWVSVPSLRAYREMLVAFARSMPARRSEPRLEAVEGGQAA